MANRDPRRRAPQSVPPRIEAVATAAQIVDFLAERGELTGVQQTADALSMTKSRASRHLANLESLGLVTRSSVRKGYTLGWRVLRWGFMASAHVKFIERLSQPIDDLSKTINRTVLLCRPANGDAMVIYSRPADASIRIDVEVGLMLSLPYSPSAIVAYAFMPREERAEMLEHLRKREDAFRVDDEALLQKHVMTLQQKYYCWAENKYDVGYGAIAAPIFDKEEQLAAVLTIVLPSAELQGLGPDPHLTNALMDASLACSQILGSSIRFPA